MPRLLVTNARIATMAGGKYAFLDRGALLCGGEGRLEHVGEMADVSPRSRGAEVIDAKGALVTPGFVDCHTHLVYGGNRAREFEMRLEGRSYEDIAREGGGIASTVRATRAASGDDLRTQARARLLAMMAEGTTTVEIKSGYGLDTANEIKCLRVARSLGSGHQVRVKTTLLGAHTVPPEFKGRADEYVSLVCDEMIPAAAREGLADAVDAFCEGIAFTPAQARRVFEAAHRHGLRVKLHADQLSNTGGAALASDFGALSADHLEHSDDAGVAAMARAGTVAVLLPGAFYMLRETKLPPIAALRRHGVPMALATDCNPGTSPITSPLAILNMACTLFRFTPEEALAGLTAHGTEYKDAARWHPTMRGFANTLSDQDRADLAAYFSSIATVDSGAAVVGTPPDKAMTCAACHGKNGVGTMDEYPNLAGQHADYIAQALNDYRLGKRKNPLMQPFAQQLTQDEIHALAAFFSGQPGLQTPKHD